MVFEEQLERVVRLKLGLKFKLPHIVSETRQVVYPDMRTKPQLLQK
jgi:hypothetical protein